VGTQHILYFVCVVLLENLPDVATRIQEQPELTLNCAALSLHSVSCVTGYVSCCLLQAHTNLLIPYVRTVPQGLRTVKTIATFLVLLLCTSAEGPEHTVWVQLHIA